MRRAAGPGPAGNSVVRIQHPVKYGGGTPADQTGQQINQDHPARHETGQHEGEAQRWIARSRRKPGDAAGAGIVRQPDGRPEVGVAQLLAGRPHVEEGEGDEESEPGFPQQGAEGRSFQLADHVVGTSQQFVDQKGGDRAGRLRPPKTEHFPLIKLAAQPHSQAHGRVEMPSGNITKGIDRDRKRAGRREGIAGKQRHRAKEKSAEKFREEFVHRALPSAAAGGLQDPLRPGRG